MQAPDFWRRRGPLAQLLAPLGLLQNFSVAFKARHARPYRSSMPVICVGNLTAGGSGKTPVAIAIAQALQARGRNPGFLTRGYGGKDKGPALVKPGNSAALMGDEALLLARTAPAIVARDRAMGAALAANMPGIDMLVMDDGHQNFSLAKNLSLVVVDGQTGFGNGFVIPAGALREKVAQGLARADAVIVMGDGAPDLQAYPGPVLRARLEAQEPRFDQQRVFAFAGIGRPEKFVASLAACGAIIAGQRFFADHHLYRRGEIAALKAQAKGALLVTTEKDWVRLSPQERGDIAVLKVAARFDDTAALEGLLDRACNAV